MTCDGTSGTTPCRTVDKRPTPDPDTPFALDCGDSALMCQSTYIECPANAPCNVTCPGANTCKNTRIACPRNYPCTVVCGRSDFNDGDGDMLNSCLNAYVEWPDVVGLGNLICLNGTRS